MEKTSKSKSARAVPEGYHTVTPYLISDDAAGLIRFIEQAFDGKVTSKTMRDDNRIMHATISIGNSTIMISDTMEGMPPHTAMLYLYLENADETYKKAIKAKATSISEPKTEFYGDRAAAVKDASGNTWWMATHVEDVSEDELQRRSKEFLKQGKDEVHA
jgi:PhnB protein